LAVLIAPGLDFPPGSFRKIGPNQPYPKPRPGGKKTTQKPGSGGREASTGVFLQTAGGRSFCRNFRLGKKGPVGPVEGEAFFTNQTRAGILGAGPKKLPRAGGGKGSKGVRFGKKTHPLFFFSKTLGELIEFRGRRKFQFGKGPFWAPPIGGLQKNRGRFLSRLGQGPRGAGSVGGRRNFVVRGIKGGGRKKVFRPRRVLLGPGGIRALFGGEAEFLKSSSISTLGGVIWGPRFCFGKPIKKGFFEGFLREDKPWPSLVTQGFARF